MATAIPDAEYLRRKQLTADTWRAIDDLRDDVMSQFVAVTLTFYDDPRNRDAQWIRLWALTQRRLLLHDLNELSCSNVD